MLVAGKSVHTGLSSGNINTCQELECMRRGDLVHVRVEPDRLSYNTPCGLRTDSSNVELHSKRNVQLR